MDTQRVYKPRSGQPHRILITDVSDFDSTTTSVTRFGGNRHGNVNDKQITFDSYYLSQTTGKYAKRSASKTLSDFHGDFVLDPDIDRSHEMFTL